MQTKIDGIPEADKEQKQTLNYEEEKVNGIMEFLNEKPTVIRIRRIGKFDPLKERPRSMIVTLKNPWDVRKILAKAHELKHFPEKRIMISESLTYYERQVERTLLFKRKKLIDSGIQRQQLKIRNLKLFKDGDPSWTEWLTTYQVRRYIIQLQRTYLADRRQIDATCIYQYMPDICLLTETWLTKEIKDGKLHFPIIA